MTSTTLLRLIDAAVSYIDNYESNIQCVCGGLLSLMPAMDIYDGHYGALCDLCYRSNINDEQFWHCLNGKDPEFHRFGFDICNACINNHYLHKKNWILKSAISSNKNVDAMGICQNKDVFSCRHLSRLMRALEHKYDDRSRDTLRLLNDYLHLMTEHEEDFNHIRERLEQRCIIRSASYKRCSDHDISQAIKNKICCYYLRDENSRDIARMRKYNQLQLSESINTDSQFENYKGGISFGYKYWNETNEMFMSSHAMYVTPKYDSFKVELTSNLLSRLSVAQFENELEKAKLFYDTDYCRNKYLLTRGQYVISIQHILALMIYCNYTDLQCEFSKTYRESDGRNHKEFYFLGMYLKIAVQKFGTMIQDGNIKTFYHGISQNLVFPQTHASLSPEDGGLLLHCPLSTTSDIGVALNFATNNGIIVKFTGRRNKYFPVAWLSDFPYEKENLFVQDQWYFTVDNIIDINTGYEYKYILNALETLMNMTSGNYMKFIAGIVGFGARYDDVFAVDESMEFAMTQILECQLLSHNSDKLYCKQLIEGHLRRQKHIFFDTAKMGKLDPLRIMYDNHDCEWIKWNLIKRLFPNMQKISIVIHETSCMLISKMKMIVSDLMAKGSKLRSLCFIGVNDTIASFVWEHLDKTFETRLKQRNIHLMSKNCFKCDSINMEYVDE